MHRFYSKILSFLGRVKFDLFIYFHRIQNLLKHFSYLIYTYANSWEDVKLYENIKNINFGTNLTIGSKLKKFPNDARSNFVKYEAHLDALKIKFGFFLSIFKILSFKFGLNFKTLQNWILCTLLYHYTNFHDFLNVCYLNWVKKRGRGQIYV